jgi:xylulose-5-phosphate/fructose-6-phosphate phosphoketolase
MPQHTDSDPTLTAEYLTRLDAYWRAANYLSVGQIYLLDNPLLREPLAIEHIKPRLLGHWGTTPGLNFVYAHLNRIINKYDLDMIYVAGPGHGGPALVANTYLEGTYSEYYSNVSEDVHGLRRLFKQFSFPGGIPSHVAPETPGSINEGGELGYSLSHAYGAAFDNPDLVVACVIGDGEAETGPLATSWHSNKFLNPVRDGAVLPILHLNGYKIAGPTVLARIPREELTQLLSGYGYEPFYVDKEATIEATHLSMAHALDRIIVRIREIQQDARSSGFRVRPRWPALVLHTPKGWTGPREVDGIAVEDSWRSHQVPLAELAEKRPHLRLLEQWMRSYRPEELFTSEGKLRPELRALAPQGKRRMGDNPHANGGILLRNLRLPDFREYAVEVKRPGGVIAEATRVQGAYIRDVMKLNLPTRNFRVFSPDELTSNRWNDVLDVTARMSAAEIRPDDSHVANDGRVLEMLSEHQCQGWLEGYLLTSHVWRQDHNGFSHQDPGFIDHVVNKKPEIIRIYLPPDANTLLSVTDHCLRSRNFVNVIVAGKQPEHQWLSMDEAIKHCSAGVGIWPWASNDQDGVPDVVLACAGDVPTLETLAAVTLLREWLPSLRIRVVNVVDLMTLQPPSEHPHGLSDSEFDSIFTTDKPILFAFHGYPWLIHRLTYRRHGHDNLHVRGYKEEGTTTTPFDMTVLNELDRFHLVESVIDRVPGLGAHSAHLRQRVRDKLVEHREYVTRHGEDMPEIKNWKWH